MTIATDGTVNRDPDAGTQRPKVTQAGAKINKPLYDYGTFSGPASYATGGFTFTIAALATAHVVMLTRTDSAGIVPLVSRVSISGNIATVQLFVATTGLEVAALTNLAATTWAYLAMGI